MQITRRKIYPFLWVLPALVLIFIVIGYPLFYALWLSLHKAVLYEAHWPFIGLKNYADLLTNPEFYNSIMVTLMFTFGTFGLEFLIGFTMAMLLSEEIRGRGVIRSLMLIPMMMPPIVVGLLWKVMLHPERGVINYYLGVLGLPQPMWLASPDTALISVIIADVWEWTPFTFLVLMAGISALPKEPFEAAEIDGAGRIQMFRHLTLPMLKRIILIVSLLRIMEAFKIFDLIYVTTMGGPAATTKVISIDAYRISFLWWRIGYGAAYTQLIFFIVMIIASFFIARIWVQEGK